MGVGGERGEAPRGPLRMHSFSSLCSTCRRGPNSGGSMEGEEWGGGGRFGETGGCLGASRGVPGRVHVKRPRMATSRPRHLVAI